MNKQLSSQPKNYIIIGLFSDLEDSEPGALIINRTISLVDTWAKLQKQRLK